MLPLTLTEPDADCARVARAVKDGERDERPVSDGDALVDCVRDPMPLLLEDPVAESLVLERADRDGLSVVESEAIAVAFSDGAADAEAAALAVDAIDAAAVSVVLPDAATESVDAVETDGELVVDTLPPPLDVAVFVDALLGETSVL